MSTSGLPLAYTARGSLGSDPAKTYVYDSRERLTGTLTGPPQALVQEATLTYDPLGRLASSEAPTLGRAARRYVYDGSEVIAELDAAGAVIRRYARGPGADEPLVWYEGSGTADRRYLARDERGSVVAVTNGSGGVIAANSYDESGAPTPGNEGSFGYTGQMWLPEVGAWHYKARVYSPYLGRFLQPDPIGTADGLNLYAYVGGDAVNATDPWGLEGEPLHCNDLPGGCGEPNDDEELVVRGVRPSRGWLIIGSQETARRNQEWANMSLWDRVRALGMSPFSEPGDFVETLSNAWDMRCVRPTGARGEQLFRQEMERQGVEILGDQVYVRDLENRLRIYDYVLLAPGATHYYFAEVKTNTATRSGRQLAIDATMEYHGGTSKSHRTPRLPYGGPVRGATIEAKMRNVRVPGC